MSERNFREMLEAQWDRGNFVCVGLDPEVKKLPEPLRLRYTECSSTSPGTQFLAFCERIVQATADLVCAYKLNLAFFERHGEQGWEALHRIITRIHEIASDVPVIADAKRADIGNTNAGYADAIFGSLQADAITVHPYLGAEALQPFLARADKGIFILCRTSNPGADEFQDLLVRRDDHLPLPHLRPLVPLYQYLAQRVATVWNKHGNCGVVVGATYPRELQAVRKIVGDMPILIPGIGTQGGDVEKTVTAGIAGRASSSTLRTASFSRQMGLTSQKRRDGKPSSSATLSTCTDRKEI